MLLPVDKVFLVVGGSIKNTVMYVNAILAANL